MENPPDVAVLLREGPRMVKEGRREYIERSKELDGALLHWGANWSKITESAIGSCRVKLVLDQDSLPTGDRAALREEVGRRLRAAGCTMARREGDPDSLRVFRVPGKGAVAWLFWNDGGAAVEVERAGRRATVRPGRTVYMRVSDAGAVESCEEL